MAANAGSCVLVKEKKKKTFDGIQKKTHLICQKQNLLCSSENGCFVLFLLFYFFFFFFVIKGFFGVVYNIFWEKNYVPPFYQ